MNPFQTLGHSVNASSAHGLILVLCEATNPLPILLSTLLMLLQTRQGFPGFPSSWNMEAARFYFVQGEKGELAWVSLLSLLLCW